MSSFKGKAKRMKRASAVEPVQEGLELCDQSGKKWRLGKLLSQMDVELTYEGTPDPHGNHSSVFATLTKD